MGIFKQCEEKYAIKTVFEASSTVNKHMYVGLNCAQTLICAMKQTWKTVDTLWMVGWLGNMYSLVWRPFGIFKQCEEFYAI